MAEEYSDEELVEAIKKWLRTNGIGVAAGLVIGLGAVLGWRFWNDYQQAQAEQASAHFDQLLEAVQAKELDKADGHLQTLVADYSDSGYAVLASFALAKIAVENDDHGTAIKHLQWILENKEDPGIADVARVRLARVFLAEKQFDDAENQLNRVLNASFGAEVDELRGDLYVAQGDPNKARNAYESARSKLGPTRTGALLQMKLDDLNS